MKIFPRILLNILPLILAGFLFVGGLTYYLSQQTMSKLAEKWLATKLADALSVADEDLALLRKYGLEKIEANVIKAKGHAGQAIKSMALGDNGFIWIVNTEGIIVVHPDARRVGTRITEQKCFLEMIGHQCGNGNYHDGHNQNLLTVYTYFAPWDWYIMASAPRGYLYGEADKMRGYVLIVGVVASALTTLVLMFLTRRLTAPLNTLANEAKRIGRGDHRGVPILDRRDEIGTLSVAFNSMTRQLSRRITQEQIISDISRQFIHLSSPNIDAAILEALEKIGEYAGADRCYVGEFSFDDRVVGQTHEWCRQGVFPQIDEMMGLSLDALPWFMSRLESDGYILAPEIEALPSEADAEKQLWCKRGIQSIVRVPMTYCGQLRGFVGLDALGQKHNWSHEEIIFLQRVAEIFCYTLERQWYQDSLAAEKERLAVTLQSIADGVITTDVDGRVMLVNRVAELLTGWRPEDAVGRPIDDVFRILDEKTHKALSPVANVIEADGRPMAANPAVLISRDEARRLIALSVAPIFDGESKIIGGVLVFRDVTEKRRIQEELIKVEKLESIGVLAGGIAHDFNNILAAIIGNVALTKSYAEPGGKVFAKMGEIEKAAFRARDLTQQLLTFSKGGEPVKKTISLSRIFHDLAMFALGGSNVKLEYTPPPELWQVEADEGQISQVINNLVINAVQAMPNGGVIQGALKNITLPTASPLPLPEGRYVEMTFKDCGSGISKENLNRIFDPFFTTKKTGSGLGLSTAYSIIEKHHGYITVESELGRGSLFTVYLPASGKEIPDLPELETEMVRGTGKILIMDDEEIILDVVAAILCNAGYEVDFARDGRQMLDIYQKALHNGDPFDVVILDLTIAGGMGGKEAIRHLLHLDPQAKALVSSGYSNDPAMADFSSFGFCGAVAKPYRIEDLCKAISDILHITK